MTRDRPLTAGSLSLYESAERVGALCWVERRLFEVLGSAVGVVDDPGAKIMLDRHAAHAAWRAQQWWDRLPVLAVIEREGLVVAPSAGLAAVYDRLAGTEAGVWMGPGVVGLLAGCYRVALPRLAAAYRAHGALTTPVADGPVRRTLNQVEADAVSDRAEGEAFLHSLLVNGEAIDEAAAAVAGLERLLI